MNRIRSNHYSLAETLFRKYMKNSARYKCGYREEDIEHVLLDCPKRTNERVTLLKKWERNKTFSAYNIREILKNPMTKMLNYYK